MTPFIQQSTNILEPTDPRDRQYVLDHEGQLLSETLLPSGAQVDPGTENKDWIAVEGLLALKLNPPTPYDLEGFERIGNDVLRPESSNDLAVLSIAQGCKMSGTILPSGARVPDAPEGCAWIAIDSLLKLKRI
jgi:hypothetical protein